ncbi:MAG TPA: prepilin-type N-terminal cleavage/methylation domain-containing protein [Roseateles sp.]|uniref:prepilin-type N-terminal cleavage/methylation domain-containing protein n=1 Tax=Roseateles sp. TaxID=1971397 RepID=UPI002ED9B664
MQLNVKNGQRGLGLVELMVGITVGLIVAAGASMVAVRQITEHRRLMLEVQIQQDLRVAADLLQQDVRRAGFRGLPANGVWEPARGTGTSNATLAKSAVASPYIPITQTKADGNDIFYQYARTQPGATNYNATNDLKDNEQFGFRLSSKKSLEIQLGLNNWQPITDPESVLIEDFKVEIQSQEIPLDDLCDCAPGSCPTQTVRLVKFTLAGVAKSDSSIKRTVSVSERIRADDVSGACPS